MNAVKQNSQTTASPACQRFAWCDGRLHDGETVIHTRRELYAQRGVEVCLSLWEPENRAYVYVNPRHVEWSDIKGADRTEEFYDLQPALDEAAEYRLVAEAIERASREAVAINATLAEVPC